MSIETLPEHLVRPALRRIHPVPLQRENQLFLGLQDPCMLSGQMMVVPPQAFQVIQFFNGERSVEEVGATLKMPDIAPLVDLVKKLDEFGLVWGPTSEALEAKKKDEILAAGAFPAGATRALGDDPTAIRAQIEKWLDEAEDSGIDEPVSGIVTTHLDYQRGAPVYAASYRTIAKGPKPDRVVILGNNHFGLGDGVTVSEVGYESPLGRMPVDASVVARLRALTGDALFKDLLDHLPEHSIQLQIPWVQHLFGSIPIVAALVPDPNAGLIADDGARLGLDAFVTALRQALDAEGGRTLFIASADLSHAGPAFGEPTPVSDARRREVEMHDRAMMKAYIESPDKLVASMRDLKNPTKWTSVGPMVAAARLAKPSSIELIDYRQSSDDKGNALVSAASMAFLA
jgi:AmmeMemoRadiSam system protein B